MLKWSKRELFFEKLSKTSKPYFTEIAQMIKEAEVQKECTFKPKVNHEGRRYHDVQEVFERLH